MNPTISIRNARLHNLKNVNLEIPRNQFVVLTGISGSGKSSLIFDILDRVAHQCLNGAAEPPGEHDSIEGFEHLDKVITIDQAHIGRIPCSDAATYSDTFTPIREAFASQPDASSRSLPARHLSHLWFDFPDYRHVFNCGKPSDLGQCPQNRFLCL